MTFGNLITCKGATLPFLLSMLEAPTPEKKTKFLNEFIIELMKE
jgi:hypothetical protein